LFILLIWTTKHSTYFFTFLLYFIKKYKKRNCKDWICHLLSCNQAQKKMNNLCFVIVSMMALAISTADISFTKDEVISQVFFQSKTHFGVRFTKVIRFSQCFPQIWDYPVSAVAVFFAIFRIYIRALSREHISVTNRDCQRLTQLYTCHYKTKNISYGESYLHVAYLRQLFLLVST
jgi:hypothetical protein